VKTSIPIGIITVSDRASHGHYSDLSGPAITDYLQEILASPWQPCTRLVPDEREDIRNAIVELCDIQHCPLVVTTGGTGPAPRDVTPEATSDACHKLLPGFGELMRKTSLEKVPTAILSRQTAGIRGSSLVVNLPGQPRAIRECLQAVMPAIPWCIQLIGGPVIQTHPHLCTAYYPPTKPQTS
jgi:molybdopterin adenylyltransferase